MTEINHRHEINPQNSWSLVTCLSHLSSQNNLLPASQMCLSCIIEVNTTATNYMLFLLSVILQIIFLIVRKFYKLTLLICPRSLQISNQLSKDAKMISLLRYNKEKQQTVTLKTHFCSKKELINNNSRWVITCCFDCRENSLKMRPQTLRGCAWYFLLLSDIL